MIRIGFTGVPGAGKTSTARALVAQMRKIHSFSKVELVQEYARRYISKHGEIEHLWEQYRITNKQIEWEDSVCTDKLEVMVTDSPVFLGFLYANEMPRRKPKDIMLFNDIFKMMTKLNHPYPRYNYIFHFPPILTPIDDGVRAAHQFSQEWREDADIQIRSLFKIFKPGFFKVIQAQGIEDRVKECLDFLGQEVKHEAN